MEQIYASEHMAGRVRRYHTWAVLHQQTTAEHSCRVATIYVELFGLPRAEVLLACLRHDAGEQWAGDNPSQAKWRHPALKKASNEAEEHGRSLLGFELPRLSDAEMNRLKICDILELWEFSFVEVQMGNSFADGMVDIAVSVAMQRTRDICETELVRRWLERHPLVNEPPREVRVETRVG
jgi:hypothetical protein